MIGAVSIAAPLRADPPPGKPWKLVFSDEFEGQTIDPAKWKFASHGGWALKGIKTELTPANSFLDGQGHFVNVLSRDEAGVLRYHHGIDSKGKFDFTYGYAEARVQFSREPGWWSAFWLRGVDKGVNPFLKGQEIDIYEDFFKPKRRRDIQHAVHFDSELQVAEESDRNVGGASMLNATRMARVSKGCVQGAELADYGGWHTVAVEWTPLEYVWYVDGKETARVDYTQVPVTTQPQHVLLSGCFRVPRETDDPKKLFYGDIREAKLPDQFMVDYVRVYQEDQAVAALTRIFLSEIEPLLCAERLLCEAAGGSCGDDAPAAPRPRPGAVSFPRPPRGRRPQTPAAHRAASIAGLA